MDAVGLAQEARRLRIEQGLSQEDVAERLKVKKQMISRAEDPRRTTGDALNSLRVSIIEALAQKKLAGPVWYDQSEVGQ